VGRDEGAAFHFPFSRDQTIFRMMCLVTESSGSPSVIGVMEERPGFCGFIHIVGAFFLFFLPFLSRREDQREQVIPHSFVPASALAQKGAVGFRGL